MSQARILVGEHLRATPDGRVVLRLSGSGRATVTLRSARGEIGASAEVIASTPEAFGAHMDAEIARWSKVVKAAGITSE